MKELTDFIFVSDMPQASDIIFLPGGSDPAVPERAAQLFSQDHAPWLLPSGRFSIKTGAFAGVKHKQATYSGAYRTECEFYTDVLVQNGVPQSAILAEDQSSFTQENAIFSRQVTDHMGLAVKRAIICCKSFHARRCLMYYGMAFPETELLVCPVDVYGISADTWFLTECGIDRVLGELARCGNQMCDDIKRYLRKEAR